MPKRSVGMQVAVACCCCGMAAFVLVVQTTLAETLNATRRPWSYRVDDMDTFAPELWGELFPTCYGQRQSPVDIRPLFTSLAMEAAEPPLEFAGDCQQFAMTREETAFKGTSVNGTCHVRVKEQSKEYKLVQFHSHAPSEHTLNGQNLAAEIHFVHQQEHSKDKLVIALLVQTTLDSSLENHWLGQAWKEGEQADSPSKPRSFTFRDTYSRLLWGLEHDGPVFRYAGSLTTPPCDENVDWWVLMTPVLVTNATFDDFVSHLRSFKLLPAGQNNRLVQPINGRVIRQYPSVPNAHHAQQ